MVALVLHRAPDPLTQPTVTIPAAESRVAGRRVRARRGAHSARGTFCIRCRRALHPLRAREPRRRHTRSSRRASLNHRSIHGDGRRRSARSLARARKETPERRATLCSGGAIHLHAVATVTKSTDLNAMVAFDIVSHGVYCPRPLGSTLVQERSLRMRASAPPLSKSAPRALAPPQGNCS
jgi:hypothetical protein